MWQTFQSLSNLFTGSTLLFCCLLALLLGCSSVLSVCLTLWKRRYEGLNSKLNAFLSEIVCGDYPTTVRLKSEVDEDAV